MTTKLLLLTLCLMLVAGCSSASPNVLPAEPTQIPSPLIPTAAISPKPTDTQTPTKAIPTSTDLPLRSCENDGFPVDSASDLQLSGEVLLFSTVKSELNALDLETQAVSTFYSYENNKVSVFGSSPDSNWLAYAILTYDSNNNIKNEFTLELLSQTGERIHHQMNVSLFEPLFHPDMFAGFGSSYWINNDLIYTTLVIEYRNAFGSTLRESIPVILNPFTGSWEDSLLLSDAGLRRETETGFSPDLQHVVVQGREIMLKDVSTGKFLWSTDEFFLGIPDSKVRWSPNGDIVAVGELFREPKIFLVTADGSRSEKLLPIGNTAGSINFEWSPNSQFLMMYHSYGDEEMQFYLYDTDKGQIILTCPVRQPWDVLFQWSPDSKQVIYGTDEGHLLLLDIPSGKVVKFDIENVLPFSWTTKPFPH